MIWQGGLLVNYNGEGSVVVFNNVDWNSGNPSLTWDLHLKLGFFPIKKCILQFISPIYNAFLTAGKLVTQN